MGTDAPSAGREACRLHADRPAVERCASCARPTCLACAVPVRGVVLCTECASRELGEPPAPAPPTARRRDGRIAAALFALGVLATLPPWDRFGVLTSPLSAWRPDPDAWPLVAGASLLAGLAATGLPLVSRLRRLARISAAAAASLGGLAALASARAIFGAPAYVTHTPAAYGALAASAGACLAGLAALRRRAGRPTPS